MSSMLQKTKPVSKTLPALQQAVKPAKKTAAKKVSSTLKQQIDEFAELQAFFDSLKDKMKRHDDLKKLLVSVATQNAAATPDEQTVLTGETWAVTFSAQPEATELRQGEDYVAKIGIPLALVTMKPQVTLAKQYLTPQQLASVSVIGRANRRFHSCIKLG